MMLSAAKENNMIRTHVFTRQEEDDLDMQVRAVCAEIDTSAIIFHDSPPMQPVEILELDPEALPLNLAWIRFVAVYLGTHQQPVGFASLKELAAHHEWTLDCTELEFSTPGGGAAR